MKDEKIKAGPDKRMIQIGRQDGYLLITPLFREPDPKDEKDFQNRGYSRKSRFRITRTKKDKGAVNANINPDMLAEIRCITDYCSALHNKALFETEEQEKEETQQAEDSREAPAFVPFGSSAGEGNEKMAKYSPAEAYLIYGDKVDGWMEKFAEANPKWKDGIEIARALFQEGKITECPEFFKLPAYTAEIPTAKRKTIYEVYEQSESPEKAVKTLMWHMEKLGENVKKFPQNQVAIDAAGMAVKLIKKEAYPSMVSEKEAGSGSAAYTVKLNGSADIKGRTPAEILLADENGADRLKSQRNFLEKHLTGSYAKANKKQIQAIDEALELFKAGKIDSESAASAGAKVVEIFKTVLLPNKYKKYEDNPKEKRCLWYSITISWYVGEPTPVEIKILNMYAALDSSNGMKPVGERVDEKTFSFSLTAGEWLNAVKQMENFTETFQAICRSRFIRKAYLVDSRQ